MGELTIVEVLDRRGVVLERIRAPAGAVSVGRAYDNDVIVDDPYVDPHAVTIRPAEGGGFEVHDLGALNGVLGPDGRIEGAATLPEGTEIRVGRTRLRIVTPRTAVAPAAPESGDRLLELLTGAGGLLGGIASVSVMWAAYSYVAESGAFGVALVVGELLVLGSALATWAAAWALATRLAQGRARFRPHFAVICWITAAALPLSMLASVPGFVWPGPPTDALEALVPLGLTLLLLHLHLGVASRLSPRGRAAAAGGTVLALGALAVFFASFDDTTGSEVPAALGVLWPLPERVVASESVEGLLLRLDAMDEPLSRMEAQSDD